MDTPSENTPPRKSYSSIFLIIALIVLVGLMFRSPKKEQIVEESLLSADVSLEYPVNKQITFLSGSQSAQVDGSKDELMDTLDGVVGEVKKGIQNKQDDVEEMVIGKIDEDVSYLEDTVEDLDQVVQSAVGIMQEGIEEVIVLQDVGKDARKMETLDIASRMMEGAGGVVSEKGVNPSGEVVVRTAAVVEQVIADNGVSTDEFVVESSNIDRDPILQNCKIKELGVEFLCDLNWQVQEDGEERFVVLSEDPIITLSFGKINSSVSYLGQITSSFLKNRGVYVDGFRKEDVEFAGRKAIKVKAYSKKNPDIRHVDYFYIHDSELYSVNFSLYPKDRWKEGQYIIKDVAKSFQSL